MIKANGDLTKDIYDLLHEEDPSITPGFIDENGKVKALQLELLEPFIHQSQSDDLASGEESLRVKQFFDYIPIHALLPWLQAITDQNNERKDDVEGIHATVDRLYITDEITTDTAAEIEAITGSKTEKVYLYAGRGIYYISAQDILTGGYEPIWGVPTDAYDPEGSEAVTGKAVASAIAEAEQNYLKKKSTSVQTLDNSVMIDGGTVNRSWQIRRQMSDGVYEVYLMIDGAVGGASLVFYVDGEEVSKLSLNRTQVKSTVPVGIDSGGTGAQTKEAALEKLGIVEKLAAKADKTDLEAATAEIETKADKSDLEAVEAALDNKADKAERRETLSTDGQFTLDAETAENGVLLINNTDREVSVYSISYGAIYDGNFMSQGTFPEISITIAANSSVTFKSSDANWATGKVCQMGMDYGELPEVAKTVLYNLSDVLEAVEKLEQIAIDGVDTWEGVRNAVRLGFGEKLFPVGYEFTTEDATTGAVITWVVRGHNHHAAANDKLEHTMTIETKYVYSDSSGTGLSLVFDATEALYYAENGLAAGTYNFTVAQQVWYAADNGKVFQFTLANAVPAGGQIVLSVTYNDTLEGKSVRTYASATSTAVIETATLTEGSEGTSLGTTDGSGNMNFMHRAIFGSNNYAQSAVRQWLNRDAAAGAVWAPSTIFDRLPSWVTNKAGFMSGLPADFLAAVQPAIVPCRTNSFYECESLDGTEFTINQVYELHDKFFLLSRPEIYGTWDNSSYKDGELLEYYEGLISTERIKYDTAGSARYCWLRSPLPGVASHQRMVHLSGALDQSAVVSGRGVAPACIIA